MDLHGTTALITGGAHRLGREMTLALARAGVDVAVNYHHSSAEALATVRDAERLGVRARAIGADVSDERAVERMFAEVLDVFSRLDLLVANAGVFRRTPFATLSAADWADMLRLNLDTVLVPARHAARAMLAGGRGCIVALADVAGVRPWSDHLPYCIAKSCVIGLVRALAVELAPAVRVNAIAPGPVLFPPGFDDDAARTEIGRTLLGRAGHPRDVAAALTYLAAADYVTGTVLPVDGGRLLRS
jgi:NAD(P)-dependent dehydrogenase (short-subunit alcohol dehydrogenase family)